MLSKNQIKEIQSLHLKKQRDLKKLFVAEGLKTVTEILETKPDSLVSIYGLESYLIAQRKKIANHKVSSFELNESELQKISLQKTPNQVLAVCHYFKEEKTLFNFDAGFTLYLDDVNDPGNFGTILRLADWFGLQVVYCSPKTCDVYNPKVIQASMGAFLRVKVVYKEISELIREQKIKNIYGALLNGNSIYKEDLKNGLVIIGNEARGIAPEHLKYITKPISIPAHKTNGTESLNAAMAASIIVSEFHRQQIV